MKPFPKKIRREDNILIAKMRSEDCFFCQVSGPSEVHHLKSRKSGGPDVEWNLVPVCRPCHVEVHKRGLLFMMQKYLYAVAKLLKKGWKIDHFGKMRNDKYGEQYDVN